VPKAVGYTRVSSDEQVQSGAGLAAQRSQIEAEATRRGWEIVGMFEDGGLSGGSLDKRIALGEALTLLKAGDADTLVVAKLDRLTRSVADFAHLLGRASKERWSLVALDIGVDTSTPAGEAMANVMATFSQLERRLIGQRTKEALAERRKQGQRLGGERMITGDLEARIVALRRSGATLNEIAESLAADGIRPPRGPIWRHGTLRQVLSRHDVPTFPRGRRPTSPGTREHSSVKSSVSQSH
jgi:DNA invertase Pin-like site-specific DNA recombinase